MLRTKQKSVKKALIYINSHVYINVFTYRHTHIYMYMHTHLKLTLKYLSILDKLILFLASSL